MRQALLILVLACAFSAAHAGHKQRGTKFATVSEALSSEDTSKYKHRLTLTQAAVKASGLEIPATATFFAPTNKAWAKDDLYEKTGLTSATLMLPENKLKLVQLLQHHIIPTAALSAAQLLPGQTLTTALAGAAPLRVKVDDDDIEILTTLGSAAAKRVKLEDDSGDDDDDDDDHESKAEIKASDIQAGQAIIHSVDELLIPASLLLTAQQAAPVTPPLAGPVTPPVASKPAQKSKEE